MGFFIKRFEEQSALRICSFFQPSTNECCTGNLIAHRGELFIATNEHVAGPVLADKDCMACFRIGSERDASFVNVPSDDLELVQATEDPDLALLLVRSRSLHDAVRALSPIHPSDLARGISFTSLPLADFALCGFPREILDVSQRGRAIGKTLSFQAVPDPDQTPTQTRLFLSYPAELPLPGPRGLSGALVWLMTPPEKTLRDQLWTPGGAVAIQSRWHPELRCLECHSIEPLREWLG